MDWKREVKDLKKRIGYRSWDDDESALTDEKIVELFKGANSYKNMTDDAVGWRCQVYSMSDKRDKSEFEYLRDLFRRTRCSEIINEDEKIKKMEEMVLSAKISRDTLRYRFEMYSNFFRLNWRFITDKDFVWLEKTMEAGQALGEATESYVRGDVGRTVSALKSRGHTTESSLATGGTEGKRMCVF